MRKYILPIIIFSFLIILISPFSRTGYVSASDLPGSKDLKWRRIAKMPEVRSNPAVVAHEGEIYIFGGNDYKGGTDTCWKFNPNTGKWCKLKNMPKKLFAHSACVVNGKIYIIGGMNISGGKRVFRNSVLEYDPLKNTWKRKKNMPTARARFGASVLFGRIYVAGGLNDKNESLKVLECYDPKTDQWIELCPLLAGRNRLSLCRSGNQLYAMGGCRGDKGEARKDVEVYHFAKDIWLQKKPMPTARKNFATAVRNKKIYAVAGWDSVGGKKVFLNSAEVYDPEKGKWESLDPIPTGRDGARACALNGKIYVIGGYNGKILDIIEVGEFGDRM